EEAQPDSWAGPDRCKAAVRGGRDLRHIRDARTGADLELASLGSPAAVETLAEELKQAYANLTHPDRDEASGPVARHRWSELQALGGRIDLKLGPEARQLLREGRSRAEDRQQARNRHRETSHPRPSFQFPPGKASRSARLASWPRRLA